MAAFVKNTKTFFNQTTAPTGWLKVTNDGDDYTLRVVTGSTGGTRYGTAGVTSAFVDSTWPGTVTSTTGTVASATGDLPSHTHTYNYNNVVTNGQIMISYPGLGTNLAVNGLGRTASGISGASADHTHSITGTGTITGGPTGFAVKYVDFILASKG